jgi:hypothetical protein
LLGNRTSDYQKPIGHKHFPGCFYGLGKLKAKNGDSQVKIARLSHPLTDEVVGKGRIDWSATDEQG